jgi:HlyD family secretion protein
MSQENVSTTGPKTQISTQPPARSLLNLPTFNENDDANDDLGGTPASWWQRHRALSTIAVILLVILLGALILRLTRHQAPVTYQSQQATRGNLAITISATGPIQSATYNLIFSGQGGKIDEIDVKVGQKVTKGQVLAKLDKTALQDAVNQAQIAVNNAQASLNAAIASANSSSGNSNASVSAAQTAVADAQANLTKVKAQNQANIDAAKQALANAQSNLTSVTNIANSQLQVAIDNYNTTASQNSCTKLPDGSFPNPPTLDRSTLPAVCQGAYDTYINTVNVQQANIAQAKAQVNTDQANLNQAKATASTNLTAAQNQVNSAQSQLNTAEAGMGVSGSSGQSQVVAAQNQLNTALAQLAQAQHNLANATLTAPHDGTVTLINGTVGGSPGVSGTGSATGTTGQGAFIQIVDLSALQVQANVNEADTANLQEGDSATFTVDAYGSQQFPGTVSAIPPIGQTISNVVTYPVTIDIDQNNLKGARLLPGMTANVTINTVQHNNVLLIPVNAINFARLASSGNSASNVPQIISPQDANTALNQARQMLSNLETTNPDLVSEGPTPAFVVEQSGQKFVVKPVVLGLTDGTSYEVLQGLAPGETFVVGTNS